MLTFLFLILFASIFFRISFCLSFSNSSLASVVSSFFPSSSSPDFFLSRMVIELIQGHFASPACASYSYQVHFCLRTVSEPRSFYPGSLSGVVIRGPCHFSPSYRLFPASSSDVNPPAPWLYLTFLIISSWSGVVTKTLSHHLLTSSRLSFCSLAPYI